MSRKRYMHAGTLVILVGIEMLSRLALAGGLNWDLHFPPISPIEPSAPVDPKAMEVERQQRERLVNELYSRYVDCLDLSASQEVCYFKWRRECRLVLGDACNELEEQMFPPRPDGDEAC